MPYSLGHTHVLTHYVPSRCLGAGFPRLFLCPVAFRSCIRARYRLPVAPACLALVMGHGPGRWCSGALLRFCTDSARARLKPWASNRASRTCID